LVEFAYTGKLVFTTENFDRMTKAITELKIKNIDQESIDKISEDIEMSRAKKANVIKPQTPTPIQVPIQQIVQVVSPPTNTTFKVFSGKLFIIFPGLLTFLANILVSQQIFCWSKFLSLG